MKLGNSSRKVVYIDDETNLVDSLKKHFAEKGVFFLHARNANDGIKKIKEEKPDIVITDILMPNMNGFDLIKKIKERDINCHAKIIILTNYGKKEIITDRGFLESLGISKYLIKSNHTNSELFSEIENALA